MLNFCTERTKDCGYVTHEGVRVSGSATTGDRVPLSSAHERLTLSADRNTILSSRGAVERLPKWSAPTEWSESNVWVC